MLHGGRTETVIRLATLMLFVRGRLEIYLRLLIMLRGITGNERTFAVLIASFLMGFASRARIMVLRFLELAPVVLIHRLRPMGGNGIIGRAGAVSGSA